MAGIVSAPQPRHNGERLIVGEKVHATNVVKLIFVGRGGVLPPAEVSALAQEFVCPRLDVVDWVVS